MRFLQAFNVGDLTAYDLLCAKYAAQLNAQPALVAHERKLREKITLMCLLELVRFLIEPLGGGHSSALLLCGSY